MSKIITALKQAIRFARGDKTAAKSTIIHVPAKPGARERAVLHAIRILHDNAYGVSIQEELERANVDLSFGALNATVSWLEDNGFIMSRWSDSTRRKKLFSLTEKGTEALRAG